MHSARRILELRCDKHSEEPNADSKLSDRCLTDPEPGMEPRQAQFRNLHSKCRCSCVLQFTRHHRVSSVLHRPPSRMIHCIVLCLDSQTKVRAPAEMLVKQIRLHVPTGGDQNSSRGGSSLNRWLSPHGQAIPQVPVVGERYLNSEPSRSRQQTYYPPSLSQRCRSWETVQDR